MAHVHHRLVSFVEFCAKLTNSRLQTSHSTVSETKLASASATDCKREEAIDGRLCNDPHYLQCLACLLTYITQSLLHLISDSYQEISVDPFLFVFYIRNTLSDRAAMKSSAALSLLFLIPSIRAAALPQLVGSELESTSSSVKRDLSGNLAPRSPQPGSSELEDEGSESDNLPEAATLMADDPSLHPSSNLERDLPARSPQGPASNPGEFTDVGLSRVNPANHHSSEDSSSSSADNDPGLYTIVGGAKGVDPSSIDGASKMAHDGRHRMMEDEAEKEHHRPYSGSHHHWNGTHRKDGILAEFNSHGEHIVVYNGTHYPNGTSYSPANKTMDGGEILEEVVVDGDEVVVYNHTRHHHNRTGGPMATATGVWLPSGTAWIPSVTGKQHHRHHPKIPSEGDPGFEGPE